MERGGRLRAAAPEKESLSPHRPCHHGGHHGHGAGGLLLDALCPHGHVRQREIRCALPAAPVRYGQLRPGYFQPGHGGRPHHLLHQRLHRDHRRRGGNAGGRPHRLLRRAGGRAADAGQRRCHRLSQHPAGAGVHLPAGLRHLQRHSGAGHRLHPQLRPCHTGGVRPAAGDELCEKRPAHGGQPPADHAGTHPAQHPAGAAADAGHRV